MANQDNEKRYRRLIEEVFNQGRMEVADELVAPNAVERQRGGAGDGPEGVKRTASILRSAFRDFSLTIADLAVDGDKVWARQRGGGTNTGSFFGFPPTGRSADIEVFDSVRIEDGRIVEHWGVPDQLGMLAALGLIALPRRPAHASV